MAEYGGLTEAVKEMIASSSSLDWIDNWVALLECQVAELHILFRTIIPPALGELRFLKGPARPNDFSAGSDHSLEDDNMLEVESLRLRDHRGLFFFDGVVDGSQGPCYRLWGVSPEIGLVFIRVETKRSMLTGHQDDYPQDAALRITMEPIDVTELRRKLDRHPKVIFQNVHAGSRQLMGPVARAVERLQEMALVGDLLFA